jgi:hypothetical protein
MTYGDRCLIGLVSKGERKGVREEHYGYPNGGLGDAIIKFILARTDLELVEMIHKVENVSLRYFLLREMLNYTASMGQTQSS